MARTQLQQLVVRAGSWVLASTVGWVVGGPVVGFAGWVVGAVFGYADSVVSAVIGPLGWIGLGAAYGAITGLVLVWLLRQPVPATSAEA